MSFGGVDERKLATEIMDRVNRDLPPMIDAAIDRAAERIIEILRNRKIMIDLGDKTRDAGA